MKKTFSVIFAIIFVLSLFVGCNNTPEDTHLTPGDKNPVSEKPADKGLSQIFTVKVNSETPVMLCTVYFTDESKNKIEKIDISDKKTEEIIQTIIPPENEVFTNSSAYFKDITFDGNLSVIIPIKRNVDESLMQTCYFNAYIYDKESGKFTESQSFREIANPAINSSEKIIFSRKGSANNSEYYQYSFNDNQFLAEKSLCWNVTDPKNNASFAHLIEKNKEKIVSEFDIYVSDFEYLEYYDNLDMEPYFKNNSLWDLRSEKWKCSFDCKEANGDGFPLNSDKNTNYGSQPSDEEVLSLVKKASEKIVFYWNCLGSEAILQEFYGITIVDSLSSKTNFKYERAVEKYSEIFTGKALKVFLTQNFYNDNGTLCYIDYEGTGFDRENFSVKYEGKSGGKYNYTVNYDHVDFNFDTGEKIFSPVTAKCSIEKTLKGYKVSDTDLFVLSVE